MSLPENVVRICGVGELPAEGEMREFPAAGGVLCVIRQKGKLVVVDNECPHHGAPLASGELVDGKVMCPWHFYGFDLADGACGDDTSLKMPIFPANIEGDDVLVKLEPVNF